MPVPVSPGPRASAAGPREFQVGVGLARAAPVADPGSLTRSARVVLEVAGSEGGAGRRERPLRDGYKDRNGRSDGVDRLAAARYQ
eukprot:265951-Rhodomonas_salina.3